jgi:hypothetical protein
MPLVGHFEEGLLWCKMEGAGLLREECRSFGSRRQNAKVINVLGVTGAALLGKLMGVVGIADGVQ